MPKFRTGHVDVDAAEMDVIRVTARLPGLDTEIEHGACHRDHRVLAWIAMDGRHVYRLLSASFAQAKLITKDETLASPPELGKLLAKRD